MHLDDIGHLFPFEYLIILVNVYQNRNIQYQSLIWGELRGLKIPLAEISTDKEEARIFFFLSFFCFIALFVSRLLQKQLRIIKV